MKKEINNTFKNRTGKKENGKPAFDWFLFLFLTVVIILLVLIFAK